MSSHFCRNKLVVKSDNHILVIFNYFVNLLTYLCSLESVTYTLLCMNCTIHCLL